VWVRLYPALRGFWGAVGACRVYYDQVELVVWVLLLEEVVELVSYELCLVVCGDHDGNLWRVSLV